jgi:hypothetical protein
MMRGAEFRVVEDPETLLALGVNKPPEPSRAPPNPPNPPTNPPCFRGAAGVPFCAVILSSLERARADRCAMVVLVRVVRVRGSREGLILVIRWEGSFVSAAEVKFGVRSAGFLAIPISGWGWMADKATFYFWLGAKQRR